MKEKLYEVQEIQSSTIVEIPIEIPIEIPAEEITKETDKTEPFIFNENNDRRQKSKFYLFLDYTEDRISKFWKGFQIKASWIIMLISLGILSGSYICLKVYEYKTDETIKIGAFIHKDKIYDVKERLK